MNITIYIDIYFIWNLLIDYILLSALVWIHKQKARRIRRFVGAFIGSIFSVFVLIWLDQASIPTLIVCYVFSSGIILYVTFGKSPKKIFVKNYLFFLLTANCMAGILMSLGFISDVSMFDLVREKQKGIYLFFYGMSYLIPAALFLWFRAKKPEEEKSMYEVVIRYAKKEWHGIGFLDTGNLLVNPVDGKPVVLLEKQYFEEMIGDGFKASYDSILTLPNLCIIPFRSVGEPNGILYGVRIEEISLFQRGEIWHTSSICAAYCENLIAKGKGYQVLLSPRLIQ